MEKVKDQKLTKERMEKLRRFSTQFTFEHQDWFEELSAIEIAFFAESIQLLTNKPDDFFELLVNRKKRLAIINKYAKLKTKKNLPQTQKQLVQEFFGKLSMNRLIHELNIIPLVFNYVVEDHVAIYKIGQEVNKEIIAFTALDFDGTKLKVHISGHHLELSPQALLYFILANEMVHVADPVRIISCKSEVLEAIYAISYCTALLQEDLSDFFIQPSQNSVTSFLIGIIMFTKTLRFLEDAQQLEEIKENEAFIAQLEKHCTSIKMKNLIIINSSYFFYQDKRMGKILKREQGYIQKQNEVQLKQDKLKQKFDQQLEKIRELKEELTNIQNQAKQDSNEDASIIREQLELKKNYKELKKQYKDLQNDFKSSQRDNDTKLLSKDTDIQKLTKENSTLQQQLTEEKRNKIQLAEPSFEHWLNKGPSYLKQLSISQEQLLQNFIDLAADFLEDSRKNRPKHALTTNKVGYAIVNEDGHFVRFADGDIVPITSIPDHEYLIDQEFIEITKDYEFARKLHHFFKSGASDDTIVHFAVVEERHGQAFVKIDGKPLQIKYTNNAFIRDGQVIGINQKQELVYYYLERVLTLDDMMPSIHLKGHEPYYVELALSNGYVLRNLNNEQQFISLDAQLPNHSFIVLKDKDTVTFSDLSGLVYKKSSFYKNKQLASVSEIDDVIYVLKQNQEYVMLQNVVTDVELDLGDMIWIDEHNKLIELIVEEVPLNTETIEQKLINSGRKVTRQQPKKQITSDEDLLIIGNIRLSERYKKYFGELGYNVDVVDGTGPFEKIRQACSKHDYILYSTAFTSHKNSGKMDMEVSKSYILCDSTAPQVMRFALEASI